MEKFLNFLADPTVQIIGWTLGGIGWIFGIISGWLQIKGYRQQSKLEQGYIAILEQAKQDWQGKYTQEQIDSMTKELKRLEESINKDVPQKARRVFLEDQLSTLIESMAQEYKRYDEISKELKSNNGQLPDQVQNAIEQEIMPKYLEQQMQQKTILSILGAFGAIFLLINIDYFRRYGDSAILFHLLGAICLFVVINFSLGKQVNRFIDKRGEIFSVVFGLVLMVGAILNVIWSSWEWGFEISFYGAINEFVGDLNISILIEWLLLAFGMLLVVRSRKE